MSIRHGVLTPTIFVMEILQIKATSGLVNPGVLKNVLTDSKKGGSFSPLMNFSNSDDEGGLGGKFSNWSTVPTANNVQITEMRPKYCSNPVGELAMAPPTKNAVAIPIWLKFNATAVDVARSSLANHCALSKGGVH